MNTAVVGELIRVYFPVFEEDGITPSSGLLDSDFAKVLILDTAESALVVTVSEVGFTGRYYAAFTPDQSGRWYLDVETPFEDVFASEILVSDPSKIRVVGSFAYDPTTNTLDGNIWLEQDGLLVTSVTSASAAFYSAAGVLLFPALVDLAPDAQGFFRVTKPSPVGFNQGAEIYAVMTVVAPSGTFTSSKGIQVVG